MRNFWSSASSPHGGKETGCGECDTSGIQFQLLAAVAEMLGRLCNYFPLYKERRFGVSRCTQDSSAKPAGAAVYSPRPFASLDRTGRSSCIPTKRVKEVKRAERMATRTR